MIEMVLVLVVIVIAGVLAAPAIGPALESVRSEAAVRRTAAFLDEVRRISVLERRILTVRCRPEESLLELSGDAGDDRIFRVPEPLALVSCSPEQLRYHPQGSATGVALLLRGRGGLERRINVGAFTGLTRVESVQ